MNAPTPEQLQKLPKWAQDYIQNITREREMSVRSLNEFCDNDTPSPFMVEDYVCTGERAGPSSKVHYVQTNAIRVRYEGIDLRVTAHSYNNQKGIGLQWGPDDLRLASAVAFVPESFMAARLVTAEHLK